jgi:[ribosomal protein S5]-alanine N-acetyltransferase
MIPKSHIIETGRLQLRFPSLDDIPVIFSATRYKGFNDGMLWSPPEKPEDLIEPNQGNIKEWESGDGYHFSIVKKSDQALVGRISIRKEVEAGTWNLGFWTHPEHQKRGYMSEAAKAVIQFGFEKLDAEKINACHALWNKASERVLKKIGMKFLKYLENGFVKNGVWMEENVMEIKREEWKELG